jgi:AcrR family transcriptional regulator
MARDPAQSLRELRHKLTPESPGVPAPSDAAEGLRERKKRLTRQQISDTATGMFLERGFDEVRVAEIAEACGVSEKTVYNYFPTKESLVLDRADATGADIRRALGPEGDAYSPVEAAVRLLVQDATDMFSHWENINPEDADLSVITRFSDMVERTPSLQAAQRNMMDQLGQVGIEAIAARYRMDPEDPEPQIAGVMLVGLWRVFWRSVRTYSDGSMTPEQARDAVIADIRRAARLIDTGLWSFGTLPRRGAGGGDFRAAVEASNQARRQAKAAIKDAREAWKQAMMDAHRQAHEAHDRAHEIAREHQRRHRG